MMNLNCMSISDPKQVFKKIASDLSKSDTLIKDASGILEELFLPKIIKKSTPI